MGVHGQVAFWVLGQQPLEYLGGMTFGPAEGRPVISTMTMEDWLERAKAEFVFKQMALEIYNFTDEEMEEWTRAFGTPDERINALAEFAEFANSWVDIYEAGIDILKSTACRCIIIGERIEAQQRPN